MFHQIKCLKFLENWNFQCACRWNWNSFCATADACEGLEICSYLGPSLLRMEASSPNDLLHIQQKFTEIKVLWEQHFGYNILVLFFFFFFKLYFVKYFLTRPSFDLLSPFPVRKKDRDSFSLTKLDLLWLNSNSNNNNKPISDLILDNSYHDLPKNWDNPN